MRYYVIMLFPSFDDISAHSSCGKCLNEVKEKLTNNSRTMNIFHDELWTAKYALIHSYRSEKVYQWLE